MQVKIGVSRKVYRLPSVSPQRHDEIQEVFRLVAFEGHHPFLVVETERVGGIQFD